MTTRDPFQGFEDCILNSVSVSLFEELYTHHVGGDIDRLNFAMGKLDRFMDDHATFSHTRDLLDLLVSKASQVTEETVLSEDNFPFVWSYIRLILETKEATLGLATVKAKMDEVAPLRNMPVSYLLALGIDSARERQKAIDSAEAAEREARVAEEEAEEATKRQAEWERLHPSDPEARRKLFASRFQK